MSEAIREAGEIPSGHLYAAVMAAGVSLEDYKRLLTVLKNASLVSERGQMLRWLGPEIRD
jgi:hypothetical protein